MEVHQIVKRKDRVQLDDSLVHHLQHSFNLKREKFGIAKQNLTTQNPFGNLDLLDSRCERLLSLNTKLPT